MWLEDGLLIKYSFENKEEFLPQTINFSFERK